MARGETSKLGRRAVITAAAGGVAAAAIGSVVRPSPVSAGGDGDFVKIAETHQATNGTYFVTSAPGGGLVRTTVGLASPTFAVTGIVYVANGTAISAATNGHWSQIGVDASTLSNAGEGIAVRARTHNGIAVRAEAQGPGGYGLEVVGRAVFNRSGKTPLAAGTSSRTISGHAMTAATIVVATVQGNPAGVWVKNVSVSDPNDTFTIRLNKAAPAGGVVVGYFIVN